MKGSESLEASWHLTLYKAFVDYVQYVQYNQYNTITILLLGTNWQQSNKAKQPQICVMIKNY